LHFLVSQLCLFVQQNVFSLAADMLRHWIMKFRATKRTENQEIMKFGLLEMRKFSG